MNCFQQESEICTLIKQKTSLEQWRKTQTDHLKESDSQISKLLSEVQSDLKSLNKTMIEVKQKKGHGITTVQYIVDSLGRQIEKISGHAHHALRAV